MRSVYFFIIIISSSISYLFSSEVFQNEFNHCNNDSIDQLKVCGERFTGTNYVNYLILANFPKLKPTTLFQYGHKHFLWWVDMEYDQDKLDKLNYTIDAVYPFFGQNCLFVVVVRDPYDWVRSFFAYPFHVHPDLTNSFDDFITKEWRAKDQVDHLAKHYRVEDGNPKTGNKYPIEGDYRVIDDTNPKTGKPFKNIMEMRSVKNENYLAFGKKQCNFLLVRYEDVRDHPEEFLSFIEENYGIVKKDEYTPITGYKGSHVPYAKKEYFDFTSSQLEHINTNLDWESESKLGYFKH